MLMTKHKISGFTLIEIMLVLVIIGIMLFATLNYMQQRALQMRIDRTSLQMQQILNAGMSYYVKFGAWPTKDEDLFGRYLPTKDKMNSPFGTTYSFANDTNRFYVFTKITTPGSNLAGAVASVLAGSLPLGITSLSGPPSQGKPPAGTDPCLESASACYAVTSVNIPGQNLNNATAVNFGNLYHDSDCVPAPICPDPTMTPQIFVVPVTIQGTAFGNSDVVPISGFTATAVGPDYPPKECRPGGRTGCGITAATPPGLKYWRVCISVSTEKGILEITSQNTQYQVVMAITRCAIPKQPSGTPFDYRPQ